MSPEVYKMEALLRRMQAADPRAQSILTFWFSEGGRDKRWFEKNNAFDEEVRSRFLQLHEEGARGALSAWKAQPGECLALIVLLDQFPRNMFRGTPRAFATDALALDAARHAVANGYDGGMTPLERMFVYLPFMHSESVADQERCCELTEALKQFTDTDDVNRFARAHRDIVARFGRFPHRNAVLGRPSTAEELEFLKGPGSSF
jgi:uncharacterized protein (DUF924 family)